MRFTMLVVAMAAAVALGACGDDEVRDDGRLAVAPAELDFGVVYVGEATSRPIRFSNDSRSPIAVRPEGLPAVFSLEPADLEVPPGRVDAELRFRPVAPGTVEATVTFPDGDTIALRGRAIERSVELPARLDFGQVLVGGGGRTLALEFRNAAELPVSLGVRVEGAPAGVFEVGSTAALAGGGRLELPVRFTPPEARAYPARLLVAPCGSCEELEVELRGAGASLEYAVAPTEVDFGPVRLGEVQRSTVRVSNHGDVPVGFAEVRLLQAPGGPFAVEPWPELPVALEPRANLSFDVVFSPRTAGVVDGVVRLQVGPDVVEVPLAGLGFDAALVVAPDVVDFGVIARGSQASVTVLVTGTGSPTLDVQAELIGDGAFTLTPGRTLPASLATPLPLTVQLTGATAGPREAELLLRTALPDVAVTVPVRGHVLDAPACTLEVAPAEVRFGAVRAGVAHRRNVSIRNAGASDCPVWGFGLEDGASPRFALPEPGEGIRTIAAGASLEVPIEYLSPEPSAGLDRATLHFRAAPPGGAPYLVPTSAAATAWNVALVPQSLDFGRVPVGASRLAQVVLENRSEAPAPVAGVSIAGGPFRLEGAPALPATAVAGGTLPLPLVFAPGALGPASGRLEVWLDGLPDAILADLAGLGTDDPCGPLCGDPQAVCSTATRAFAKTLVPLRSTVFVPGPAEPSCAWRFLEVPAASAAAVEDPTACTTAFRPDRAGRYRAELSVTLPGGETAGCIVETEVEPLPPLWIETAWDAEADVDLHLFHPAAGDPGFPEPWFDEAFDCFFGNQAPFWDGPGRADDPRLDRDDAGFGPEAIRIDQPSLEHPYVVGVHYFRRFAAPHVEAHTRVYCGGELAGEGTSVLGMPGEGAVVGQVRFTAPEQCTFTPDGRTVQAGDGI